MFCAPPKPAISGPVKKGRELLRPRQWAGFPRCSQSNAIGNERERGVPFFFFHFSEAADELLTNERRARVCIPGKRSLASRNG